MAEFQTNTLVGIIDSVIGGAATLSWEWNKIGGKPDWMYVGTRHPKCYMCQRSLTLVCQLYCPLEGSLYHRTIYVFTCLSDQCQQKVSFRVFRAQKLADAAQSSTQPPNSSQHHQSAQTGNDSMTFDTDWCDAADDWGDAADDWGNDAEVDQDVVGALHGGSFKQTSFQSIQHPAHISSTNEQSLTSRESIKQESQELEQCMEQLSLQSAMRQTSQGGGVFPDCRIATLNGGTEEDPQLLFVPYFVDVFEEPSPSVEEALSHELKLLKEYQQREGVSMEEWEEAGDSRSKGGGKRGGSGGGEGYEKSLAKHGDKMFQKFAKKIQSCPQQCIRYSYNGSPLWLTTPVADQTSPPRCQSCGSHRQFEFQLMPAILPSMQLQTQQGHALEFGVVVVYTCSQSCWSTDSEEFYREEVAAVQQDPDSAAITSAQKQIQVQQR
ncbi:programmed cell death protein 2-like [Diadema setosum]|uniref:programmed cell death protein 2-like n=1 Tax=Diadema setosum TaxID=31175 RepID=UPI003B3A742D